MAPTKNFCLQYGHFAVPVFLVFGFFFVAFPVTTELETGVSTSDRPAGGHRVAVDVGDFGSSCADGQIGVAICPKLFVLGNPKSGTTTFFGYLESHRDFRPAMPLDGGTRRVKEVFYFSKSPFCSKHSGPQCQRHVSQNYLPYFQKRTSPAQWTTDASPAYLYKNTVIRGMKNADMTKDARFVVLLRDPVERAISDMEKKIRGNEDRPMPASYDLEEVTNRCLPILSKCRAEANGIGIEGIPYFHCALTVPQETLYYGLCESLNKGFYADALRGWIRGGYDVKNQFCVVSTARFVSGPRSAVRDTVLGERCLKPLGIDTDAFAWEDLPEDGHFNVHNTSEIAQDTKLSAVRQRLYDFFEEANKDLVRLLDEEFGIPDFKYNWP